MNKVKVITVNNRTNKTLKIGFGPQQDSGEFHVTILPRDAHLNQIFIVKPNTKASVHVGIVGYNYVDDYDFQLMKQVHKKLHKRDTV